MRQIQDRSRYEIRIVARFGEFVGSLLGLHVLRLDRSLDLVTVDDVTDIPRLRSLPKSRLGHRTAGLTQRLKIKALHTFHPAV